MSRVIVLAGGSPHAHDFVSSGAALVDLAEALGHEVAFADHPDDAAVLVADGADALVVDGLWWRMEGDAYDQWRDRYAYSPPPTTREALTNHVWDGGGLLAVHTTSICFDDWPGWGDVVGGAWRWGVSTHPPVGPVAARVVGEHPVVAGLPPVIELEDEVYGDLDVGDGVEVLVVARRHAEDAEQPVVWVHEYGAGRVVYDGLGHGAESIRHPVHGRLLAQALGWTLGE